MALDLTGLTPLEIGGLDEFDTGLDTSGLVPLDTSGLTPIGGDTEGPGRLASAGSSFARGLGQTVSGLPKSLALLSAPDPEILRNLDRIDRGEPHRPQFPRAVGPGAAPVGGDPNDPLYARYQQGAPEERQRLRQEIEGKFDAAMQSVPYEAGQSIDRWFADNFPTNPEFQDEFWTSKVPQALGSATGFVLSALLTRGGARTLGPTATKVSTYAAPAGLGSSLNRVEQFEGALEEGADIATALEASELGALIGVSEAVPIGNLLNRLDRASGGAVKRYLVRAVQQGSEEAVQEAFSGIMNAAVAQQLYDPERGIWTMERVEEGGVGFTTGAILETLMTLALPGRRRGATVDIQDSAVPETATPKEATEFGRRRLSQLQAQQSLSGSERQEMDFLRQDPDPGKVAEAYGVQLRPPGDRIREDLPLPTEADIESPIPTELIQEGKAILEDALGGAEPSTGLDDLGGAARAIGDNLRDRLWAEYEGRATAIDPLAKRARAERPGMSREEFLRWIENPPSIQEGQADEQATFEKQEAQIEEAQGQEAAEARPAVGPGRPVLDPEITEPLDVSGLMPVATTTGRPDVRPADAATEPVTVRGPAPSAGAPLPAPPPTPAPAAQSEDKPPAADSKAIEKRLRKATPGTVEMLPRSDDPPAMVRASEVALRNLGFVEIPHGKSTIFVNPVSELTAFPRSQGKDAGVLVQFGDADADQIAEARGGTAKTVSEAAPSPSVTPTQTQREAAGATTSPALPKARPETVTNRAGEQAQPGGQIEPSPADEGEVEEYTPPLKSTQGREFGRHYTGPSPLKNPLRVADAKRWNFNNVYGVVEQAAPGSLPFDTTQSMADIKAEIMRRGYDGVVYENEDGVDAWIAFAPGGAKAPSPSVTEQPARAPESPQERRTAEDTQRSVPEADRGAGATKRDQIEDFGEVLEGARKHVWEAYRDRLREAGGLDIAAEPLSRSWPQADYQKLLDEGADPWVVAFIRAARDEIPTKPQKPWRRKEWVKQVEALRNFSEQALDGRIPSERIRKGLDTHPVFKAFSDRVDLYAAVGHAKSLKGVRISAGHYSMLNGEKLDPPKVIWTVERAAKATAFSNWPTHLAQGDSREEAIASFKRDYAKIEPQPKASKQVKFDIYSYRRGPKAGRWIIGKKIGKDRVDLREFDGIKEARSYLTEHHDELVKALDRWKSIPAHRKESDAPRIGADHRNGADITPEVFAETFRFRGVQFGNYVEGGRRQQDLNQAYDALLDLAGVLDVPARALSLNGELGLAFGARGKGGKRAPRAHYEPGTVVINLTKREGAGSLAHEWWHSLDNYFSRRRGGRLAYVSEDASERGEGVRPEVVQAFANLVQAINQTSLRERSRGLDRRRTKPYWSTGREMSARAFESHIVAKLQDQEASNDYLANIVSEDYWKAAAALGVGEGTEQQPDYPYPTAAEIPVIRAGFDALFETIETRETEAGIELFSLDAAAQTTGDLRASIRFSEEWQAKRGEVAAELRQALDRIGLRRVALRLPDSMDVIDGRQQRVGSITGRYTPGLIDIALPPERDYGRTLRHEAIHALKDIGVFRDAEWRTLERAAKADADRLAEVGERYAPQELTEEQLVEEAVADMYGDWHAGNSKPRGFLRTAFERIRAFFEALGNVLQGNGFQSASDVFESVERGDVGARPAQQEPQEGQRFALRGGDFNPERAAAAMNRDGTAVLPRRTAEPAAQQQVRPEKNPLALFRDGFATPEETLTDLVRQKLQDKYIDLRRVQEAVEQAGKPVDDLSNAYMLEELYHGKAEAEIEEARKTSMEPLLDTIRDADLTVAQAGEYLYARHAKERNARIQEINPRFAEEGGGSGMTDAEANAILKKYPGAKVDKIGELADAITAKQRNLLVSAGLETAETVAAWEQMYQHYVPLKGREGIDDRGPPVGSGFDVRGKTKRAFGRRSQAKSIIANLLAQYEATIVRAQKAEVGRALLRFVEANPNVDLWEVDKAEYQASIDRATGLVVYRPSPRYQLADNVLVVKVEGADHHITFHGPRGARIAGAMKNLGAANAGSLVRAMAAVNRVLAMVNTSLNPEFVLSNLIRDVQTAGINLAGTEADAAKMRIIKDVGKAWHGIRRAQKGKTGEWAEHYRAFRKAGGKTGWIDAHNDVDRLHKQMERELKRHERTGADPRRLIRLIAEFVENENTAVENAARLSAFVHAMRLGASEAKAASLAKNLTVNFNRKGEYGVVANSLYLFYNASVQGSVRMLQALHSPKVRAIAGGIVVFAAVLDMMNRMLGGEDDDDIPLYDKIPPWVKERNLIIMNPWAEGGYFKVALPWGYNVFHVLGQQVGAGASAALGQNPDFKSADAAMSVISAAVGSFNPLGSEATLSQFLSPTATDPIVSVGENLDWSGRPIRPGENPFEKAPTPDSQKYWQSTSEISKQIAAQLNELTGGTEIRPGLIDVSPTTLDYLYEFASGGVGRFISNTVDAPLKKLVGDDVETYRIPFVRKVYGEVGAQATQEQFYENLEQVFYADRELKLAKEAGDGRAQNQVWREHGPYLDARLAAKVTEKRLRKLREQRDRIRASGMSERAKRERLEDVEDRMEEEMLRFNKRLREAQR